MSLPWRREWKQNWNHTPRVMLHKCYPVGLWLRNTEHHALPCTSSMSRWEAVCTTLPTCQTPHLEYRTSRNPMNSSEISTGGLTWLKTLMILFPPVPGKLLPLPTPNRPWSHIDINFLTDLPESEGTNTLLVSVDGFFRAIKLTPLHNLPSAFQTAELLFQHIFWAYGIPEDIISDQRSQFLSQDRSSPVLDIAFLDYSLTYLFDCVFYPA